MGEFLRALADPDIAFLRYAFLAGLLASVAFGVIGTYVVVRRISYIAGAISHCVLGGIGAALYLQKARGLEWCDPMLGAVVSALLSAIVIGLVSMYASQREDTVIGSLWATGMAVGLLFLARTPGYIDPMSYLFGSILLISKTDLFVVAGLDAAVVATGVFFYNKFLALCFDEEFTRLRGVRVGFYYMLLLCLTALTVVLLVRVVGIVMVIALLTLPSAVAGQFARRLWHMMLLSIFFCAVFNIAGLAISYIHELPSGPTIIVLAAATYLAVLAGSRIPNLLRGRGRKSRAIAK
ncbi:MAG TPA: metal ABC transporter permease [Candidatus Brocadiia bacterium]|nr:metal ABC transporter permease [Candidatus Brocadiia bacterium]